MLDLVFDHSERLGRATWEGPARVEAGAFFSAEVRFDAAVDLPAGTRFALARRWPSDWGSVQSADPEAADFFRAGTSDGAPLRWWTARLHSWHPFDHVLFVELLAPMRAGCALVLRFGDTGGGSPGARAQTFIEEASPLSMRVLRPGGEQWTEIARLESRVVGTRAHRAVLSAPSRVRRGERFEVHLRIEDAWGNPASGFTGRFLVEGADDVCAVSSADGSAARIEVTLDRAGVYRLRARRLQPDAAAASSPARATGPAAAEPETASARTTGPVDAITATGGTAVPGDSGYGLDEVESNPIVCDDAPGDRVFWGDLHGQSLIGCGARSIDAYYRHARDFAACDFASHQANCFLVTGDEWRETQAVSARLNDPGRYVTLLGVEWSAASHLGGDRNLYFSGDAAELHRCSHEFIADKSDVDTDLPHADDLHRHYGETDTLVALHVGGRTADLRWHDPRIERLLEVHSTHATSEWFLFDALERGYRMGVIAGSDGVDGRPGASHPGHLGVRNVRGGVAAVAMPELTREALLAALRARRCYATTGERIVLELSGDGRPMGSEYATATPPTLGVRVEGTAPLEAVELFRGTELLFRAPIEPADPRPGEWIRIGWSGASAPGNWQRARMSWDGGLSLSRGRIAEVRPWALDTPDEWVRCDGDATLRWRSVTAGDWDGALVRLDGGDDATLSFVTEPMTLTVPLARLADGAFEVRAENPSRTVRIERLPRALPPASWAGTFTDTAPLAGCRAYWVRVRQHDGAYAWSSPVFVTVGLAQ